MPNDIWTNHKDLYPIPEGFKDSTYRNDVTPSYTGLGGRCMVWMFDEDTQKDVWGDATNRPLFTVNYHPTDEVYGLSNEEFHTVHAATWDSVLQLLNIIAADIDNPYRGVWNSGYWYGSEDIKHA